MTLLYDGGWFQHQQTDSGIEYLSENHDGVTVLPFNRRTGKFLCLYERVSATLNPKPVLTSLTGGMDKGEDPLFTALRELREEAGMVILSGQMISLGTVYTYKGCTKITHMFGADITEGFSVEAMGDGSDLEAQAYVKEHTLEEVMESGCALLLASVAKLIILKKVYAP